MIFSIVFPTTRNQPIFSLLLLPHPLPSLPSSPATARLHLVCKRSAPEQETRTRQAPAARPESRMGRTERSLRKKRINCHIFPFYNNDKFVFKVHQVYVDTFLLKVLTTDLELESQLWCDGQIKKKKKLQVWLTNLNPSNWHRPPLHRWHALPRMSPCRAPPPFLS